MMWELFHFDDIPDWAKVSLSSQVDGTMTQASMLPRCAALVPFLLMLLVGHYFGPTSHVFLDIACIQQDDEESKAQGIEQLGAVTEDRLRTLLFKW